jgi:hypothetical protein
MDPFREDNGPNVPAALEPAFGDQKHVENHY